MKQTAKQAASQGLEVFVNSVNYVLISYALSNMALVLRQNPLFILFFASEVWVMGKYWQSMFQLTGRKFLAALLLVICFAIHGALVYFVGRFVGDVVPFLP